MKRWLGIILAVYGAIGWVTPFMAQALEPVYRASFNEKTFSETGWSFFQSGADYEPASVSTGLIPSSPNFPDYSDGRGIIVTALSGQGSFIYGPVIPTNGHLALIRISVLTLAKGGTLAAGALNVDPKGSIATTNSSVSYAFETDSEQFMGDYQYIHVLFRPQNKALIPIFQLAVPPSSSRMSVTAMFDNLEVYLVKEDTLSDPGWRTVFGFEKFSPEPTLTPTVKATSTPTPTPTVTPTPTPKTNPTPSGSSFVVDTLYTLTRDSDQKEAFNAKTAFDRGDSFAIVAADLTGGYQDINLRNIDINKKLVDGPYTVNQTFQDTVAQTPDVAVDFSGTRHIVWSDNRSIEKLFSIYLAQMNSAGSRRVTSDFEVNNLFESTNTAEPALAVLDDGDMAVCWRDDRNFLMDLFVRRLHWDGGKITAIDKNDFQINIPFENTHVSHPDIAMTVSGIIAVVWSDDRVLVDGNKRNDIYARIFSKSTAYGSNRQLPSTIAEIQVSGVDTQNDSALHPQIAHQNGKFVIVWQNRNPVTNISFIYAAVLNENGTILHPEFLIDSGSETSRCSAPSIAAWQNGQFFITWYNDATNQIVGRIYDAEKHLFASDPVILVTNVASTEQTSVAISKTNRAYAVWDGVTRGFRDIFGASLSYGLASGPASLPQQVSANPGRISPMSLSTLSVEDGRRESIRKETRDPANVSPIR